MIYRISFAYVKTLTFIELFPHLPYICAEQATCMLNHCTLNSSPLQLFIGGEVFFHYVVDG